ncbi:hypothetical protein [Kitasatospora sp. NPDC057198]|uniref:hypothetical protein n=1 Tax=Kitasatospora sp. NPDC057198 TaxID=3346046 RepID=UPI0036440DA2
MSTVHPPAPPGLDTGPLPARGVIGLQLQFCLQWIWLPFRVALHLLNNMPSGDCAADGHGVGKFVLTPSRYRLERSGTREEWEAWAERALDQGLTSAMAGVVGYVSHNNSTRGKWKYKGDMLVPETTIRRRYYRGIGPGGLAVLAARRGWQVDWRYVGQKELRLFLPPREGSA